MGRSFKSKGYKGYGENYEEKEIPMQEPTQQIQIRPVTASLLMAVALDTWPSPAAIVDFGIDSQEHYEALYYPIRKGEITPAQLEKALGNGPALTALVRSCKSNPRKNVLFSTAHDDLVEMEKNQQGVYVQA